MCDACIEIPRLAPNIFNISVSAGSIIIWEGMFKQLHHGWKDN